MTRPLDGLLSIDDIDDESSTSDLDGLIDNLSEDLLTEGDLDGDFLEGLEPEEIAAVKRG